MGAALDELLPNADVNELWYGEIGAFAPDAYRWCVPDLERQWRAATRVELGAGPRTGTGRPCGTRGRLVHRRVR